MATKKTNKNNTRNPQSLLFRKLTKLLSGPLTNYRTQTNHRLRRIDLDKYASRFTSASGRDFKKTAYNPYDNLQAQAMASQARTERYVDFDQMEYCLHGDTKIAVPGGYKTLKELEAEYGTTESFIVYSYDHNKSEIVPALGKQSRKTTADHAWKVTFENGQEIIGTANHRLMLRDGTYRRIDQLEEGAAMMPFYRKDLINSKDDTGEGYRWIYSMHNDSGRRPGWKAEHIMIAEWVSDRRMLENEVVHHKNFVKNDNNPENLAIMDNSEHLRMHQRVLNDQRKDSGWWDTFKKNHSAWMKENNPAERKDITYEKILYLCDVHGYNQKNICSMLDTNPNTIKRRLRTKGFSSFENFAKTYDPTWVNASQDNRGHKNPRYDETLTFQAICDAYEDGMSSSALAETLDTTYIKIRNRLKTNGYENYSIFKKTYGNHKVAKIEYYGHIDLYDLTVDGYKNFATDTVISHNTPEIASAIDIYADEMTTHSGLSRVLNIQCDNEEIKLLLESLYQDVLNVEYNLFSWCRAMCKYGDFFLYLDLDESLGITSVIGLPTAEVERLEGEDKQNPDYVQYQWNTSGLTFENWQIGHFRILGNDKYNPYGTSVLEPARRIWRQLTLLEDAMMAYRIVRSPERRAFYIDVGSIAPQDVEQYMQKAMTQMKRNQVVDASTGRVDLRYNPLSVEEDYFIPVRGGTSGTKIESIAGGSYTGDIDDVKYLRDKLFSALKIPAAYLSSDAETAVEDKTTLAQKDIRFARTVQRLQRSVITELEKIGIIHLYTIGYREEDLVSFKLSLNNPSKIAEMQELEHWKTKFDIANSATEGFFSKQWLAKKLFGMSDEEFIRNRREMFYDRRFEAALETAAEAEQAAATAPGGELGGDMGEEGGTGMAGMEPELGAPTGEDDLGGDLGGMEPEGASAPEGPEEGDLLAAPPGKRDDGIGKQTNRKGHTTTSKSHGWYEPRNLFTGGDRRKSSGPRKKNINRSTQPETGTKRKNFPGAAELASLTRGTSVYENRLTIYSKEEEDKLLKNQEELKLLFENLDLKSRNEKDETET